MQPCSQVCVGAGGWMAGCSTLLVTVLIASVGEALPEIIHSIPKDSDSRLYGVEACGGWGWCVEADKKKKEKKSTLSNYQKHKIPQQIARHTVYYVCGKYSVCSDQIYKGEEKIRHDRVTPLFRTHFNRLSNYMETIPILTLTS